MKTLPFLLLAFLLTGCSTFTTKKAEVKPAFIRNLEIANNQINLYWESHTNEVYTVYSSFDLSISSVAQDNIQATPPLNVYSEKIDSTTKFYKLETK
jgi:hypothetical protein